jgi:hypothetical protein
MGCVVVYWARTLWLRRKFAGSGETKFTSFASILIAEVVWDFQYFSGLLNDMKMTSVDVCQGFSVSVFFNIRHLTQQKIKSNAPTVLNVYHHLKKEF